MDFKLSKSLVGPLKWIGPSTEEIIVENSKLGKTYSFSSYSICFRTFGNFSELDIEYKELADKNGCKNYSRVPALGTNENFIKAMSNLIIHNKQDIILMDEAFSSKTMSKSI